MNVAVKMSEHDHHLLMQLVNQLKEVTSDHEKRIRWLERVISYSLGGGAVLYWLIQRLTENGGS